MRGASAKGEENPSERTARIAGTDTVGFPSFFRFQFERHCTVISPPLRSPRRVHLPSALYLDTLHDILTRMLKRFRHKGLQRFFETESKAGIQAAHAPRLRVQLARLDKAVGPRDMNLPNWRLHPLKSDLAGHWAVWVDENWRLTFTFEDEDATLVDYQNYH